VQQQYGEADAVKLPFEQVALEIVEAIGLKASGGGVERSEAVIRIEAAGQAYSALYSGGSDGPTSNYSGARIAGLITIVTSSGRDRKATFEGYSPGVYTYTAPGMPPCPQCGRNPTTFYCSTHSRPLCLDCVARHDEPKDCVYVPAFRAPRSAVGEVTRSGPDKPPTGGTPGSVLGIR
jgi:hypothetical protein